MLSTRLSQALLVAPALFLSPLAERPMLSAEKGTSVDKLLSTTLELEMVRGVASFMGEEQEMGEDDFFMLTLESEQEVTDVYGGSKDGVLQGLDRTYNSMSMDYESEDGSGDMDGFDEIEGATVRFTRGEDGWAKSYVAEEGDDTPSETLLEGLHPDMDLSLLLPPEDVEEGDSWSVTDANFRALFVPGGMPTGDEKAGQMATLLFDDLAPQFAENMDGFAVDCTLVGTDSGIAEIAIKFEGSVAIDSAEFVLRMTEIAEGEDEDSGIPEDVDSEMEIDFETEGSLFWDMKAGHVHAFEISQSSEALVELFFSQDFGDQTVDIEVEAEFTIDLTWKLELQESE